MKKNMIKGFLIMLSVGILAGCSSGGTSSSNSEGTGNADFDKIMDKKELRVATASGYAPYEFIDLNASSTEVVGVDMAFAEKVAEELGVKLVVQDMTFGSILGSLTQGSVDLAIAGMSITEERKQSVDFSEPYLKSENRVIALNKNVDKFKTIDDLNDARLGAQQSTTQETIIQEAMTPKQTVTLEKIPDLILELLTENIDGIVIEDTVAQQYLISNPDIGFTDIEIPEEYRYKETAVAIKKGNQELVDAVNKVIQENQDNGNFDQWVLDYSEIAAQSAKTASK
ncbi:transporter substrate-binding domain-containing protein [Enterococcus saccharolyticus]|uniref:transporter substrate-binding domain-containing protein n=1 Tax=Enterococcus saccharolyticus TaxID=41997 RepID=UPI0039E19F83